MIGGLMLIVLILVGFGVNHIREGGAIDVEGERLVEFRTDILPPSSFLVEAFALASIMAIHEDSWDINDRRLAEAEEEYWKAQERWSQSHLPAELKTELAANAQSDGKAFWEEINERLKPAAKKWDTQAILASHRRLLAIYRSHRSANDEMVARSSEMFEEVSDEGATTTSAVLTALAIIGLFILAMIGFVYIGLKRRVLTPMADTARTMDGLAGGDLEIGRNSRHTDDEIGDMTRAIETFREALKKDRVRSQEQAHVVETLSTGLEKISAGDFTHRIDDTMKGEHAALRDAFNSSADRLSRIISDVRASAQSVNTGSSEILSASEDTAHRNEQQAASVEETAASMREVTDLVKRTASNAQDAKGAMLQTNGKANEGGEVVKKAVKAMASIEESSSEITQIIDVIDGIAFQTNLLALNAGVEAARAGDAGKGFAVVANEVRALAQRSAEAAQNIKQLISTSTGHVAEGVDLVDKTGELLDSIVEHLSAVSGQVEEIADMAALQASNLDQVNSSVSDMDTMTQQNAAMVEETAAASRSLSNEAERLGKQVEQFKIASERGRSSPPSFSADPERNAPFSVAKMASPPRASAKPINTAKSSRHSLESVGNLALKPESVASPLEETESQDWSEF